MDHRAFEELIRSSTKSRRTLFGGALGFPPESACAPVSQGRCAGGCPTGMACLPPCGYVPPDAE
jgi:hypothetical protein